MSKQRRRKLYCYVDETGQDARSEMFIVSVMVADENRDQLRQICEAIEAETGKGQVKWIRTAYDRRLAYIRRVLDITPFRGKLNFAVYIASDNYLALTVRTIARALTAAGENDCKVTVLIDGLPRSQERMVGSQLRQQHIHPRKVRGIKKDENDALIRLADALCGFVRAAREGQPTMRKLFEQGIQSRMLVDVSGE